MENAVYALWDSMHYRKTPLCVLFVWITLNAKEVLIFQSTKAIGGTT